MIHIGDATTRNIMISVPQGEELCNLLANEIKPWTPYEIKVNFGLDPDINILKFIDWGYNALTIEQRKDVCGDNNFKHGE